LRLPPITYLIIAASSRQLTIGQIKSLGITMILVFGIMFILFMSLKVGLIAILPTKLYSRLEFLKTLDTEIQRARHCCASLSCCLLKIAFEEMKSDVDNTAKDRIIRSVGSVLSEEIRDWDTLHRYDGQSYALLMLQTSMAEAQRLCNHLNPEPIGMKRLAHHRIRWMISLMC